MSHLLLRHSFRFNPASEEGNLPASEWTYARELGMWKSLGTDGGEKPRPVPVSKKADEETGEDMKGE